MDLVKNRILNLLRKDKKDDILKKQLEKVEENVVYGQTPGQIGIWIHDIEQGKTLWTKEVYRILCCDYKVLGDKLENILNFVHQGDKEKVKIAFEKALEAQEYEISYRIITNNGVIKYIQEKTNILYDQNDTPIHIIGIIQDISAQIINEKRDDYNQIQKIPEICNWKLDLFKEKYFNKLENNSKNLFQNQPLVNLGNWEMDLISNRLYLFGETFNILGINPEKYNNTYEGFIKFLHPDDIKKFKNILTNPRKEPIGIGFKIIRPDGSIRYTYHLMKFEFNQDEKPVYLYGIIQDITLLKELQGDLEETKKKLKIIKKKYEILLEESIDVFEIIKPDGTIKFISKTSEKVIGYKPEERIGRKVYEDYQGKEITKISKMIQHTLNNPTKKTKGNVIFTTKEGKKIYLEVYMQNLLHEPAIDGIMVNFRDITKRIEMRKLMTFLANRDELTGLPNSVSFKRTLRVHCQRAKKMKTKFAVMMLDIDGLKNINYSLGYDMGNQLILDVVKKIKEKLDGNLFFSRYSEDHFAFIVQGLKTHKEYQILAKDLLEIFSSTFKIDKYEIDVSANIGICIYPDDGQDEESLRKHAKVALLRAKKERKNSFKLYSSDLDIQNYKEFIIRSDLHHAIEKKQLKVYYQPIVNLKTSEILAVEALIRWEHPDWGIIKPEEFIPIAEENELIVIIGKWLLKEICRTYQEWLRKKLPKIKVTINFSSIQFFEKNFVNNIKNTIDEYNLDPHFLIMEITENILMKNIGKINDDMQKLRAMGIQIALDDFGTGYSSLAYLNSFNIDILKLDGLFIKNAVLNETSSIITRFIVKMATELKIKLVAEGIENLEQLSYLNGLNCHVGQGFIFSKPVTEKEIENILVKRKCRPKVLHGQLKIKKERRQFFRIKFYQLLEAEMTILTIKGKDINVGNTKVLIKNIGLGGLCFISNIKFPIGEYFILQFTTQLLEENIKVYGYPVWIEEIDENLYEYGIQFTIDENERMTLTRILNQVQIKMKNNILFAEGNFISYKPTVYFNEIAAK